ncbi:MAG: iron-containing alcohol dehydrogenase [Rhodospirillales bacterium]
MAHLVACQLGDDALRRRSNQLPGRPGPERGDGGRGNRCVHFAASIDPPAAAVIAPKGLTRRPPRRRTEPHFAPKPPGWPDAYPRRPAHHPDRRRRRGPDRRPARPPRPLTPADRHRSGDGIDRPAGTPARPRCAPPNWGYSIFSDTIPEPEDHIVAAGVAILRAGTYDCLLAFGGGSPIDTAKAHDDPRPRRQPHPRMESPARRRPRSPPRHCRADHRGTGSEATRATVITDTATQEKMLIMGLGAVPLAAIGGFRADLLGAPRAPPRTPASTA